MAGQAGYWPVLGAIDVYIALYKPMLHEGSPVRVGIIMIYISSFWQ